MNYKKYLQLVEPLLTQNSPHSPMLTSHYNYTLNFVTDLPMYGIRLCNTQHVLHSQCITYK